MVTARALRTVPQQPVRLMVLHVEALLAGVDIHRDQRPLQGQRLSRPARGHVIATTRLRHAPAHHGGHGDGVDVPGRTDQLLLPAPVTPAHITSGATPGVACAWPKCCQPGRSWKAAAQERSSHASSRQRRRSPPRAGPLAQPPPAPTRMAGGPGTRPSPGPARHHRPLRPARRRSAFSCPGGLARERDRRRPGAGSATAAGRRKPRSHHGSRTRNPSRRRSSPGSAKPDGSRPCR